MKYLFTILSLILLATSPHAEELVQALSQSEEPLTVTAVQGTQFQPLIEIKDPAISTSVYALKGMVRYESVQGEGFLQLDNDFGERGNFFTKSLAPAGPLGKISGSSDWRPFTLPFYAGNDGQASDVSSLPQSLALSVYLPGSGTVSVSDVALYQYAAGEDPLQSAGSWFGNRSGGLIGGIGGAVVGLWGALIGILAGRGKARNFVLNSANLLLIVGAANILGGALAMLKSQPYAVYFPFFLVGAIILAVFGTLRGSLRARYEQLELKKMQSMDA